MGRRIRWLGMVLVVCFAAVIAQLVNIQMRQASALDKSPTNPRNAIAQLDNYRGTILAGDGTTVLAQSQAVPNAKPGEKRYYRTYPGGSLYSGIVGYDSPYYGTSAVENVYNTYLSLHSQPAKTLGQLLSPPPPTTDNVTLTIQPTLQQTAAAALQQTVRSGNHDGAIVVMNPKTGAILAMYSNPSFDPNAISVPTVAADQAAYKADTTPDAEGFQPIEPMATFDPFPPGSTYKIVTTSAVYNLKPTLAGFTWGPGKCTKPGTIPGTTHVICNDSTSSAGASLCGGNITQMLPASCDPGYVMLGLKVGATAMYQQSKAFGVDSVPPVDLTTRFVSKSHFPTAAQFTTAPTHVGRPGLALVSFGQGTVALTALQNAMNAATVANTGAQMTPHVMSQIRSSQGSLVKKYKPTVHKQVMSAAAAQQVKRLMGYVVTTPAGTGYGVGFPRTEQVGVKTGTAQITTSTKLIDDWMIGIAPITDPTVAVAVVVPRQPFNTYGATTAGPIMKRMIAATLAEEKAHGLVPSTSTTQAPPPTAPLTTTTSSTTTTTTAPPATTTTTTAPPATTTTTAPPATTTTTPATTTSAAGATTAAVGPARTTPPPGAARPPSRSGASP